MGSWEHRERKGGGRKERLAGDRTRGERAFTWPSKPVPSKLSVLLLAVLTLDLSDSLFSSPPAIFFFPFGPTEEKTQ